MKRTLFLLWLLATASHTLADVVEGIVIDKQTSEPIENAEVSATMNHHSLGTLMTFLTTDTAGRFRFEADDAGKIKVEMLGYETQEMMYAPQYDGNRDTLRLDTIRLNPVATLLSMATVSAKARRFTMHGDTIVFNPAAFRLEAGARLDELISKLPGVTVKDGKMQWNGKPIRVLMNGQDLVGGNATTSILPAEAVEKLKLYNKASEFSERTGKDDGEEDMVLDMKIKPGFLDRWFGDLTAGYQTAKHHLATANLSRLSDKDPAVVHLHANDVNDTPRKGVGYYSSGSGGGIWANLGREQFGSASHKHQWKTDGGLDNSLGSEAQLGHRDAWGSTHTETERTLADSLPLQSKGDSRFYKHRLAPNLHARMEWRPDSANTFRWNLSAEGTRRRDESGENFSQNDLLRDYQSTTRGDEDKLNGSVGWKHYIKEGSFGFNAATKFSRGKSHTDGERLSQFFDAEGNKVAEDILQQRADRSQSQRQVEAAAGYEQWVSKNVLLKTDYKFLMTDERDTNDFFENGVANLANSYSDHTRTGSHLLKLSSTLNLRPFQLMPAVEASRKHEWRDYQRGILDTVATRNTWLMKPSLSVKLRVSPQVQLSTSYAFSTTLPDLIETLAFRDDTDPLNISIGNPALHAFHTHTVNLSMSIVSPKHERTVQMSLEWNKMTENIGTATHYDPSTRTYLRQRRNFSGGSSLEANVSFFQRLSPHTTVSASTINTLNIYYGVLTTTGNLADFFNNNNESRNSQVLSLNEVSLNYEKDWLEVSVMARTNMRHNHYTQAKPLHPTNWDNKIWAWVEAHTGNWHFGTSLDDDFRLGYGSHDAERHRFVWNTWASLHLLKNKLALRLHFDDILHQKRNYSNYHQEDHHTVTWSQDMNHYVRFTLTYSFDPKTGKRPKFF